ncbi:MAG: hypothetical protein PHQ19_02250 [Candidatus Krumholzibacteria bacterium]|nr:hypothetical protein [Candidatus Krumholzibacteria bacterium]
MRIHAAILCVLLLVGGSVRGEDVTLLCRNFTTKHDIGLAPIAINAANWITGLDCPGEYIQTNFTIQGFGTDRCELIAMGAEGVPYRIVMTLTGVWSGEVQQIDFDFIGSGFEG